MARTAFLRPNRLRAESLQSSPVTPCRNPNPNSNSYHSRYQKRSPAECIDRSWLQGGTKVVKLPSKGLIMGQVKILKRGEKLEGVPNGWRSGEEEEFVSCLSDRFDPDPDHETETPQNKIMVYHPNLSESDVRYAGPVVFLASPPPSSLPLPAFLSKEKNKNSIRLSFR